MGQDEYHKKAKFYWLSNHAQQRLWERSSLSARDLAVLIENASMQVSKEGSRVNALLYSPIDEMHLIAVYDENNLEIVTILPPDRHFKVGSSDLHREKIYAEAKKLVESQPGLGECLDGREGRSGGVPLSLRRLASPGISVNSLYSRQQ